MTEADFLRKKIVWPKFGVFGHFLEFESLDFADFAYYDRQA